MRYLILLVISYCTQQPVNGQLNGKVTKANGQPLPMANVLLLNATDSTQVKATITNETGKYLIKDITAGNYLLQVSSIGFSTWYSNVFNLLDTTQDQPLTIILKEENTELKNVIVRSEKPLYQQQPAGMVVNVENSLLTKGSSALDVLERSPGVTINNRDNSIELYGRSGVMVMLNGRLMRMPVEQLVNLLNGMSAADIEKIELLTTPPAGYDAEGSGGIINIVLKKSRKQGTNGSISVTGGYGKRSKGATAFNLSHNNAKTNLYGSYNFSQNRTYSEMYITSAQHMPFMGGDVRVIYEDTTRATRNSHDATAGIDVKLNSRTTIGGSINYNNSSAASQTITNAGYNVLPDSLLQFNGDNSGQSRWNNLINTVYMEKNIREGERLWASMDYLYFTNRANSFVQSSFTNKHGAQAGEGQPLFAPGQQGFARTDIRVGVAKIDYGKTLGKKVSMEAGIKASVTQSTSISGIESLVDNVWKSDHQTSNNISMKEGIGAAYSSFKWTPGTSLSITAGVRYEYSYTSMKNRVTGEQITTRKLGALFPSLLIAKKMTDLSELQLSFSKRISRPSYNDLASYVGYSDPTAVYTGNPLLQPSIAYLFKLGYNYKSYAFSVLMSHDKNAIARYQLTESDAKDMLLISPQNLAWQDNISLQVNLPVKVKNWWTMSYSFTGGFRRLRVLHVQDPLTKNYFGYNLNFNNSFKMPGGFSAELSGWYNSTSYNGTVKMKGFGVINAGIKKELNHNSGSLQLAIADIMRAETYNVAYGTIAREAFDIKSNVSVRTESAKFPIIRLTYTKSFGMLAKRQARESNSADDEKNRIRKE